MAGLQPNYIEKLSQDMYNTICDHLGWVDRFCLGVTCRKFYLAASRKDLRPERQRFVEREALLKRWERDQFFQGLVCHMSCNVFHPTTYFDSQNQARPFGKRACMGNQSSVTLHPKWKLSYEELRGVKGNLTERTLWMREYRVHKHDRIISNYLPEMGAELEWCEHISSATRLSLRDLEILRSFTAKNRASNAIQPGQNGDLTIDNLDAWTSPMQFFRGKDGSFSIGLIWFLNLPAWEFPQWSTVQSITKELDERDLGFHLCPHIKMIDPLVTSAMVRARQWNAVDGDISLCCDRCTTLIKVRVQTPRFILVTGNQMSTSIFGSNPCVAVEVVRNFGILRRTPTLEWINQMQTGNDGSAEALSKRATYKGNWIFPPTDFYAFDPRF